jgi:hypothetical protein
MIKFDNQWMKLHVKSMGKLHLVHSLEEKASDAKNDLIQVAELDGRPVMAKQYAKHIPSSRLAGNDTTGFYIEVDGRFFDVKLVTNSVEKGNKLMSSYENAALIATDDHGFHYIAETNAVKLAGNLLKSER